ncbi:hypothetical protein HPO96_13435 [Kribbella sandramycini]|uniref:Uncharacterized protein n=1 Tax=Kribbella sandramycini TaxID=60450 RepID=A0A7Y4KYY4_9ACTN|nr:hypothetical protein [Kribbella sandramycini]MBB6568905.1 hypothetical protein [Kribbella sandramycini]NOL41249.1 hypothetical protein [Kribbella sandramycini]
MRRIVTAFVALLLIAPLGVPAAVARQAAPDPVWTTTPVDQRDLILTEIQGDDDALFAVTQAYAPWEGQRPGVLRKDGGKWVRLPDPDLKNYELHGLVVGSVNDVWVVGASETDQPESTPRLLHWDGKSWTVMPGPDVPYGVFGDIERGPDGSLWVTGWGQVGGRERAVVYRYADGRWQSLNVGLEDSINGNVLAVLSATDVWLGLNAGLAHWDGKIWTYVDAVPTNGLVIPLAFAADDRNNLWLTGIEHVDALGRPFVLRYDGTTWTRVEVGPTTGSFKDIAIWNGQPIAVGERLKMDGRYIHSYPIAFRFDGAKFVETSIPVSPSTEGALRSLVSTATRLWTSGHTTSPDNPRYNPLAAFTS